MLRCNKIILNKSFQQKVLMILFLFSFSKSWGQAILTFDFAGATGTEASYSSSTNNANLNSSTITRSGLTTSANADRFGSTSFATSATIDLTKYIEFTVTPLAGYQVSITSVVFLYQRSGTGPLTFALRSSFDSYASNLGGALAGTDVTTTQTFSFTFSSITPSCGSPVTFRFYAYASEATTGTGGPEDGGNTANKDIVVNGSVSSCGACTPPTTTVTPPSQTVCANTTATVSISSSATIPTYQWQMSATGASGTFSNVANGTPTGATYGGATSASLTMISTSTVQYYYQCLVTENGTCTATSASSSLTVISSPSITSSPASASVTTSGTATFVAGASGTGLSYQWQVNSGSGFANVSGGVYSGGTTATLSVTNPSLTMNSYSYQCVVSNSCGTATTNIATLTVTSGPCINEGFNGGTTAPSGWTFASIGSTYTSAGNFGASSPALSLDGTGDRVTTIALSGNVATSLSFWIKGQGTDATSSLLVEGFDGVSWVTIDNIAPLPTTGTTKTYNSGTTPALPSNLIQFRFTYTKSAGNLAFDDVVVNCGPSCSAPTTTITATTQTVCAGTVVTLSVSSSASSPSYTWQASANGTTWSSIVNGTPTGSSYSGSNTSALTVTAGATYYYHVLVAEGGTCTATSGTSTLVVISSPTITTQPIGVTTSSTGTASYTVIASGGNLSYQWQENSGSGFGNISNGGSNPTYAGATSSVLTISNPPLSMSGYSYQCIVSNACGTVTTNGTSTITVTTLLTCPRITGALINACDDASCAEGNNEMLFLSSGSYAIPVNGTNVNITFGGTNFTGSFTPNAALTSSLNTSAGCSLFTDASSGTIPSNSTFIIMNDDVCLNYDFSSYCSAAPIYVIYSSGSWNSSGFFTNSGSTTKSWVTNFSSISGSCPNTTYSYIPDNLTQYSGSSNGASVVFDNLQNPTYINNGCTPPALILPIELIDFYGTQDGSKNNLVWKVASEKNVAQYIVEKSEDGNNFKELTRINSSHYESGNGSYSCIDEDPFARTTYYRLGTLEDNYKINYYRMIDVDRDNKEGQSLVYQNNDDLILEFKNAVPKETSLQLYDLTGKLLADISVRSAQTKINTMIFAEGIYFIKINTPYKTENFKIIIQK